MNSAADDLRDTVSTTIPDFSIGTILFFMPHLRKKPGQIVDVTSAVLFPNTLSPRNVIAAAQKAFDDLPLDAAGIEHYRAEKSGCKVFTVFAAPSGNVLAKFDAAIFACRAISISLPTVPSSPSPSSAQQSVEVKMSGLYTRSHTFVYHSRTYAWNFISGIEIRLQTALSSEKTDLTTLAAFWFADKWFASRGVLAFARQTEGETAATPERGPEWEKIVVVTLLACLRREREWRYTLAGHGIPIPRTCC